MSRTDILVINPGSTSTKLGIFREGELLVEKTLRHDPDMLLAMGRIPEQMPYRTEVIEDFLKTSGYDTALLKAVVGRGGMSFGIRGGGYIVDEKLCEEFAAPDHPQHAANLGGVLALKIAEKEGIPAYIYDSPMGCELTELARISGVKGLDRFGNYHVLNSKAQARNLAVSLGKKYEDLKLVVCHMGGGITVTVHKDGNIIDGMSYDEGHMSPERCGGIGLLTWDKMLRDENMSTADADRLLSGKGGMYSYLGTTDCIEIEKRISEGDSYAALVYEAMAYQTAKSIAAVTAALKGEVDYIILTGGVAHSKLLTGMIRDYASWVGEILVMPGEDELKALAEGAERILNGEEEAHRF